MWAWLLRVMRGHRRRRGLDVQELEDDEDDEDDELAADRPLEVEPGSSS